MPTTRTAEELEELSETPMTAAEWAAARRAPRIKIIRRALGLTQERFSDAYRIPVSTPARLGARPQRTRRPRAGVSGGYCACAGDDGQSLGAAGGGVISRKSGDSHIPDRRPPAHRRQFKLKRLP